MSTPAPQPLPLRGDEEPPQLTARTLPAWLPLPIAVVLALLVVLVWAALSAEQRHHNQILLQTAAANVHDEIMARIETRLHALQRLARRTARHPDFRPDEWVADAQLCIEAYPELEAVEWLDSRLALRAATPAEHQASPLHAHAAEAKQQGLLRQARDSRRPALAYLRLAEENTQLIIAVLPVYRAQEFAGVVVGVFRNRELLQRILRNVASGYALSVSAGGDELYSRQAPGAADVAPAPLRVQRSLHFEGAVWQLAVWPEKPPSEGATPELVLTLGLLMSALVSAAVYLAQAARRRSRQFQAANFLLQGQIEQRRRGEQQLQRLNRSLRALGEYNQVLVHATDEPQLLQDICRIFVQECGYLLAWVGYAEADANQTVRVVASAGAARDYMQTGMVSWADVERGRGPTGTAIRTARPAVCHDTLTDPAFAPWRERALQRGFRSCVALPLLLSAQWWPVGSGQTAGPLPASDRWPPATGHCLGALSLYAPSPAAFDEQEIALLSELAQDLAFGIQTLRTRAQHERAQERLRYLASIVEDSEDAIYSKSLDGAIVTWNRGAERMFGYTAAEAIGRHVSFLAPPDRLAEVDGLLRRIAQGHTVQHYETVRQCKDGTLRQVSLTLSPLHAGVPAAPGVGAVGCEAGVPSAPPLQPAPPKGRDGVDDRQGRLVGASSIARDITQRKLAERRLYDQQFYTRSLIEASLDPLMTTDAAGIITDVNQQMELLTGCVRAQLIGSQFQHYCTEPARAQEGIRRVLAEGKLTDYELTVRSRDGRHTVVAYNATLYRDWQGKLSGVFAAARDITARKLAERELRRYTAELARSNAELQDFASIASHDLQEPLRKVMAFGDQLMEHCGRQLDEQGRDFLGRMHNAAARMSALINALLDYSRVSSRAQPFQPVDLQQVALEVVADLEAGIQQAHAAVSIGILPRLLADRTQMRQLLQNLLSNAVKFHPPATAPQVWIDSRQLPTREWEIRVRDNGIGFEPKHLERIFRPFQRLHARSEFPGSGMGLAICRKIVARHGGTLTATSQPGQGATFIATLPAEQSQVPDPELPVQQCYSGLGSRDSRL